MDVDAPGRPCASTSMWSTVLTCGWIWTQICLARFFKMFLLHKFGLRVFFNVFASHSWSIHPCKWEQFAWMDMDAWTMKGKILEKKTRNPRNCVHPRFLGRSRLSLRSERRMAPWRATLTFTAQTSTSTTCRRPRMASSSELDFLNDSQRTKRRLSSQISP